MKRQFSFLILSFFVGAGVFFTGCEKEEVLPLPDSENELVKESIQDMPDADATAEMIDISLPDSILEVFKAEKKQLELNLQNLDLPTENSTVENRSVYRPISGAVSSLRVNRETNEWGSDEPYVIVTAIQLPSWHNNFRVGVRTTITGVWGDADTGEHKGTVPIPEVYSSIDKWSIWQSTLRRVVRRPFWNVPDGRTALINHPDDVVFLVAMMEHDNTPISYFQNAVEIKMMTSIANLLPQRPSRSAMVAKLKADMNSAITATRQIPVLPFNNSDDQLGRTKELRLSHTDLNVASNGTRVKSLRFSGSGGLYTVYFRLQNADFFY